MTADLEQIVGEVMRRLVQLEQQQQPAVEQRADPRELVLDERVVTLATLKDRLDGIARVVMPAGAVVTPSARDELRRHNITVHCAAAAQQQQEAASPLLAAAVVTGHDPARLLASIAGNPLQLETIASSNLAEAVATLCQQVVTRRRLALLLTDQPAAALCLANRRRGVCAAAAASPPAVKQAVSSIGANLLVVDSREHAPSALRAMVAEFVRGGWRCCPDRWRGLLD